MRVTIRPQGPQCFLLSKQLEPYAYEVEVEPLLPRYSSEPEEKFEKVDCSINAYPIPGKGSSRFASLYFVGGRLLDGDVIVEHEDAGAVDEVLPRLTTCRLVETHFHGSEEDPDLHYHLEGCSVPDLGKVLEAGGYKG